MKLKTILLQLINEEKQVGNLYHFTNYRGLAGIVSDGMKIKTSDRFVSFTRNKRWESSIIPNSVRISLDGDKLSRSYRITPFADTSSGYGRSGEDESEERIDAKKYGGYIDISGAIKEIIIEDGGYKNMSKPNVFSNLIEILDDRKIKYTIVDKII